MQSVVQIKQTFKDKNLKGKYCLSPLVSILVDPSGNVFLCGCNAWMPTSVGNLFVQSLDQILSSELAIKIRQSIIDGSYRYCDESRCGILRQNLLNTIDNVPESVLPLLSDSSTFIYPYEILFAGDLTCNLSCPSCRTAVIKTTDEFKSQQEQMSTILQKNLFSVPTENKIGLTLSTSGELFASPFLLKFLSGISITQFPNLHLSIQTNGLLCPSRWDNIVHLEKKIRTITVTVDSCKKHVYEKLRRGGQWEDIVSALSFIKGKKESLGFSLHVRMVAQLDNHPEIYDFYNFSKSFSADRVEYVRILDYKTYSPDEFKRVDVFNPAHPLYQSAQHELNRLEGFDDVFLAGDLRFQKNTAN